MFVTALLLMSIWPNRFTLPNRNAKISIQYHSYNASATCITVLQDRVMAHIRINVANRSSVAMRAGRSWIQCTGPAASGPESRTRGVDCGVGSESDRARCSRLQRMRCSQAPPLLCASLVCVIQ